MASSPGTWPVIATVLLMRGLFAAFPAAASVDVGDLLLMDRFHQWQATHNRSYLSAEERLRRFEVYRSNVEYIEATNRRGDLTYELGENQFADLTEAEFLARYGSSYDGSARTNWDITMTAAGGDAGSLWSSGGGDNSLEAPLPPSVDWRAKGAVTPARTQGSGCASCWAFATVATIESLNWIKTGKLVPLSEQQLVDCDQYDGGCNRGYYHRAMKWIMENGGLTTAAEYPYKAARGACKRAKPAVNIKGHLAVPPNEAALQSAVARQPIGVAIEIGSGMMFYKSGVYSGTCGTRLEHAITAVGYGTDPAGTKYWIVKNSWGPGWGENGFIRMKRDVGGSGLCGIALDTAYPTM
ncbi:senescence-specific cysteine protease SAG39 [Lolium perenne]|uniref:senescence-specific cysteine protease SAG39 n=1 Tax=Lolium perenne TaxID=4522 RepID=UPI0021EB03E8|nr:ervatamin-C-like isoform X2 [Lolium perenne]